MSKNKAYIYLLKTLQDHFYHEYGIYHGKETIYFIGVTEGATPREAKKNATRYGEPVSLKVMEYTDYISLIKEPLKVQESRLTKITHNKKDAANFASKLDQSNQRWINQQIRMLYS